MGIALLPVTIIMLELSGPSGALATRIGPRAQMSAEPAITVAPPTATVLAAVPASYAGMASAANNTIARASSLIAVAVLPALAGLGGTAYLEPARFSAGFGRACLMCAGLCLAGGVVAAVTIRDPAPASGQAAGPLLYCALDAPPARAATLRPGRRPASLAELPGLTMWVSRGTTRLWEWRWPAALPPGPYPGQEARDDELNRN